VKVRSGLTASKVRRSKLVRNIEPNYFADEAEMSMTQTLKLKAVYLMDYESFEGMTAGRTPRSTK
jgi:hypothetical protein